MDRKIIALFTFPLLIATFCYSQYEPFPSDSAVWYRHHQTAYTSYYSSLEMLGDTVINSKAYKKVYNNFGTLTYAGGIRQDILNEKIFQIDVNGQETDISFDQHILVGSSIACPDLGYNNCHVKSIDSVLIGSKYRKQFEIVASSPDTTYRSYYVAGVGTVGASGFEWGQNIVCFSIKNQKFYGYAPSYVCQLSYLGMEEIETRYAPRIEPNPASTNIFVDLQGVFNSGSLTIYSFIGQELIKKEISENMTNIDIRQLQNGVYFLKFSNAKTTRMVKFVKE
jgi:hypothetical protein